MKFLGPKPGQSLDLFRMLANQEGYKLTDPESNNEFINNLKEDFTKSKNNPIQLHGFRIQAMFEYVVTSLGKCIIVKTEDAGGLYTIDPKIKIPDLRVVLNDGQEFLIEVKNFHQSNPFKRLIMKKEYLDELQHYASIFNKTVKIAIYWSRWNVWTLIAIDIFKRENNKCSLTFESALKFNEMAILGDYSLGTISPLKLRVFTDPLNPRTIDTNGNVIFKIGGLELFCNENRITTPREKNLALFLMLYGDWPSEGVETIINNDELISFDFVSQPIESNSDQGFDMIGVMSGMISRHFNKLTTEEGVIKHLSPQVNITNLGFQIPDNYQGQDLHLWRFIQQPSYEKH